MAQAVARIVIAPFAVSQSLQVTHLARAVLVRLRMLTDHLLTNHAKIQRSLPIADPNRAGDDPLIVDAAAVAMVMTGMEMAKTRHLAAVGATLTRGHQAVTVTATGLPATATRRDRRAVFLGSPRIRQLRLAETFGTRISFLLPRRESGPWS